MCLYYIYRLNHSIQISFLVSGCGGFQRFFGPRPPQAAKISFNSWKFPGNLLKTSGQPARDANWGDEHLAPVWCNLAFLPNVKYPKYREAAEVFKRFFRVLGGSAQILHMGYWQRCASRLSSRRILGCSTVHHFLDLPKCLLFGTWRAAPPAGGQRAPKTSSYSYFC